MSVDDLRAKAWEVGALRRPTDAATREMVKVVPLSDAEAVVERAERRVRELEALLGRCLPIIASMGGGERAQLTQDCLDALPREITLGPVPGGET